MDRVNDQPFSLFATMVMFVISFSCCLMVYAWIIDIRGGKRDRIHYIDGLHFIRVIVVWRFSIHGFTPRACTRSKVIGSVVVVISTKIAKSRKTGVGQSAQCHQTIESHALVCFKSSRKAHEHYKINRAFSPATPTYQCHVLFPMRMLDLKTGRGRRVIKSRPTVPQLLQQCRVCALVL